MLSSLAKKLFGSTNDRRLKSARSLVQRVNALESEMERLSDEALRARTDEFRAHLARGGKPADIVAAAFATVREASRRVFQQRHFDVQIMGGHVLDSGSIAEMKTGEGKTLVSTLAAYLNALEGKGVHVVTVNPYLAMRDAETMGRLFSFLGLTTGVVVPDMPDEARRAAYACDVTYGTNSEFGFDYLRDNMKASRADQVQRGHRFAIVDEVDSILIDEARTPLIISGPADDRSALYLAIETLMGSLRPEFYEKDEKRRSASLTDEGSHHFEALLQGLEGDGLYDPRNSVVLHALLQALIAHVVYERDKDYLVQNGEVLIIDMSTGRVLPGRRYSDGLHQALEAKERVRVQPETRTLASITFQNYFRLYDKLAGMTGTAGTEEEEFRHIYSLDVVEIPTNRPVARLDEDDAIYRTAAEKYRAIVREIAKAHERHQPVLVGTASVEQSDHLARLLEAEGYSRIDFSDAEAVRVLRRDAVAGVAARRFAVLNARLHGQEAAIIAEAGLPGAITIATNMAGRGTDIRLGGNPDALVSDLTEGFEDDAARTAATAEAMRLHEQARNRVLSASETDADGTTYPGGLYVIGTERHESRRIDNQLQGRAGRQGDPGRSRFYLSLQDDLVRIFGPERIERVLDSAGFGEGEAIIHPLINRLIGKAQRKVENQNYEMRKEVLKYDDVVNHQRKSVFAQREAIMDADSVRDMIHDMRAATVQRVVDRFIREGYNSDWDVDGLAAEVKRVFGLELPVQEWSQEPAIDDAEMLRRVRLKADEAYDVVLADNGAEPMLKVEKAILLQLVDRQWQVHLTHLDELRDTVGWRALAQRDPVMEFKAESFDLFGRMSDELADEVTRHLMHVYIPKAGETQAA